MTGRIYTVPLRAVTITATDADFDLVEIGVASDIRAALHMFSLTTDAAAEQFLDLCLIRRSAAGTGGSAITESPVDEGNTRPTGLTALSMVTSPGTAGAVLKPWIWGLRTELLYIPTPECRPIVAESKWLSLHCATSVTGTIKLSGFFLLEEF